MLDFPRARPYDPIDFWDVVGSLAVDPSGNVYITDFFNGRLRKVTPDGIISSVADGICWPGGVAVDSFRKVYLMRTCSVLYQAASDGLLTILKGSNTSLRPGIPYGVATDANGNVSVANTGDCNVLGVSSDSTTTVVAGDFNTHAPWSSCQYSGDGGPAASAAVSEPYAVAVDSIGNVYIADEGSNRVRKVSSDGIITTVAGGGWPYWAGGYSGDGGPATSAQLNHPHGVAVDAEGNLHIADSENFVVRKVAPDGTITTVADNGFWCCGDWQAGRKELRNDAVLTAFSNSGFSLMSLTLALAKSLVTIWKH